MKTTLVGLGLLALASVGCGKPMKADVNCSEHPAEFSCAVSAIGGDGKNYSICWDTLLTCADGAKLTANTCQDVAGGGKATSIVPKTKFTGGGGCKSKESGIAVENVKITQK